MCWKNCIIKDNRKGNSMRISKIVKGIVIGALTMAMFLQPKGVHAASENQDPQSGTSMSNSEQDGGGIALFSIEADPYTGLIYTHNHPNADNGITYGIDVSYYNGSIDWNAVRDSGIKNVMVRVGYRGYGSSGSLNEDTNYKQNIEGALDAGLNVGVYFFSQAISQQEASDEADYIIERIQNYNITLPVVIDFEYASVGSGLGGRLYNADLSADKATRICKAFCRIVEEEGYTAMVYANKSMLEDNLNASDISDKYGIWLANYTTSTSYNGRYDVWQYSSRGHVDGISGYVDCNFWYEESETIYNGIDYAAVYDYNYYITAYEDVRNAFHGDKSRTLEHFVTSGMSEGRQGNAEFNAYTYKNRYPDLRSAFGNDLKSYYMHYIINGKQEGRDGGGASEVIGTATVYGGVDYSSVYDYNYYIEHNADVQNAFGGDDYLTLQHFVTSGMFEGRQGNSEFNVYTYKNRYSDLRGTFGNDLKSYYMHYITCGKQEGRDGSGTSELLGGVTVYNGVNYAAVYDYNYYIGHNTDVQEAFGGDDYLTLQHFVTSGMSEGRQGNEEFNVFAYKNRYNDLQNTFGSDLRSYYMHYISNGKQEGRSGEDTSEADAVRNIYEGVDYSAVYDKEYYMDHNEDVGNVIGDDDYLLLQHFILNGMHEGRQGSEEFNVYAYRDRYSDLNETFGDDLAEYYIHYITCGKLEGRDGRTEADVQLDDIAKPEVLMVEEETIDSDTIVDPSAPILENDEVGMPDLDVTEKDEQNTVGAPSEIIEEGLSGIEINGGKDETSADSNIVPEEGMEEESVPVVNENEENIEGTGEEPVPSEVE